MAILILFHTFQAILLTKWLQYGYKKDWTIESEWVQ